MEAPAPLDRATEGPAAAVADRPANASPAVTNGQTVSSDLPELDAPVSPATNTVAVAVAPGIEDMTGYETRPHESALNEPALHDSAAGFSSGVFRLSQTAFAPVGAPPAVAATWRLLLQQLARHCRNTAPLLLTDLLAGAACLVVANASAQVFAGGGFFPAGRLAYLLPALVASLAVLGLYPGIGISPVVELRKLTLASMSLVVATLAVSTYSGQPFPPTLVFVLTLAVSLSLALPSLRAITRGRLAGQDWWGEPVLVFGGGALGARVHDVLTRDASRGMRSLGFVDELHTQWRGDALARHSGSGDGQPSGYLGPPEMAADLVEQHGVQWAVIACGEDADGAADSELLSHAQAIDCLWRIPNRLVVSGGGVPSLWTESRECAGAAALHVGERLLMPWPQFVKRGVDLLVSITVAALACPIFLLIALLVSVTSKGPIFYGHKRIGLNGQRFRVWKFRTMFQNADAWLQKCLDADSELRAEWERDHKLRRDPRITAVGGFLRKSSLDELPQLWNVLRGDMSLVGPRPIVDDEVAKYKHVYPMYTRVRPGITGLWQISGRNQTTYEERIRLDDYYVRNWSPWLDIYILARTVKTVLLREGAY